MGASKGKVCIFCGKGPSDGVGVHPIHGRPGEFACLKDGLANLANHTYRVTVPCSVIIPECFGEGDALEAAKETIDFPFGLGVHAQWQKATVVESDANGVLAPAVERMNAVLSDTFGGLHHAPRIHKHFKGADHEMWEVSTFEDLATFDSDLLTRLVIAAHQHCVRVSVLPSSPGMVKIRLHPRFAREGRVHARHPTIEDIVQRGAEVTDSPSQARDGRETKGVLSHE